MTPRSSSSTSEDTGPSPEGPAGAPVRDLFPAMDARFVLVEIGKLSNQMAANTRAIERLADKVSDIELTVKTTKTVGIVLAGVFTAVAGGIWWLATTLWPLRTKLVEIINGG